MAGCFKVNVSESKGTPSYEQILIATSLAQAKLLLIKLASWLNSLA